MGWRVVVSVIVNTFVPSGGGEWTVIGPIVIPAARDLGVPVGQAVIAYMFGASLAALVQPFWALPLLAITDTRAREIFDGAITSGGASKCTPGPLPDEFPLVDPVTVKSDRSQSRRSSMMAA